MVSLRSKDRFKEEEVGLVTLPLEDVVRAEPQYFRCRDTNKVKVSFGLVRDFHGGMLLVSLIIFEPTTYVRLRCLCRELLLVLGPRVP